jgi:hypothetical protein
VPQQHYVHDFPNVDPGYLTRKTFRWWFFGTCLLGGAAFAYWTTDQRQHMDPWYQRPDFRPFPAMVPKEELDIM